MPKNTIYIFTNDLRLHDNAAYSAFLAAPSPKMGVILLDDAFAKDRDGTRSGRIFMKAAKMLVGVMKNAGHELKLIKVASKDGLPKMFDDANVIISFDTTPFARNRLTRIMKAAARIDVYDTKHLVPFIDGGHATLTRGQDGTWEVTSRHLSPEMPEMTEMPKKSHIIPTTGKEYKVYSSFYKSVVDTLVNDDMIGIPIPRKHESPKSTGTIELYDIAMKCIASFDSDQYRRLRKASVIARQGSTRASWAIARGIVSIREVYETVRKVCYADFDKLSERRQEYRKETFIDFTRELIYRDFYSRATWWWLPKYSHRFRNKNAKWKVTTMRDLLSLIKTAPLVIKTIYNALVDDGNVSNYGRMLFATWVYDVGADWQLGEALFKHYLIDYDFSSNHWNWAHHSVQGLNFQWPAKKYNVDNVTLDV